ncbi:MAG: leucine-rich repeat domain-containing protein, partial [Patescibacteria group bacterium]|nr:leucine-rich repeat domain-containing protein [Patescibacteria group bacterium]
MLTQNKKQFKARMKKSLSILVLGFLVSSIVLTMLIAQPWQVKPANAAVITFPDANLEAAVRDAIGKPTGDIYDTDVSGLTSFSADSSSISDITGMEYFTSLTYLNLSSNQISDISALSTLTSLTILYLYDNQISDISFLSGLINLTQLDLWSNQISDISALSGLTDLTYLSLYHNQISDISALSGLTDLIYLSLSYNQISNLSALSTLTSLTTFYLDDNQISDISALSGLTDLTYLSLYHNQISDISALSGLTDLTYLSLYHNQISDISALSTLTSLTTLYLYDNQISDISALSGLTDLIYLSLSYNQISDLSALSILTNLTNLNLYHNQISDISSLSSLINLTVIELQENQISDISVLSTLTNLQILNLHHNQISDISALSGLTDLTYLELSWNKISNIDILSNLINLQSLSIYKNNVFNIAPLIDLINLTVVDVRHNLIDINLASPTSQMDIVNNIDIYASIYYNEQYESYCSDGYDNDQDGNIDTADSDCELPSTLKTNGSVSPVNVVTTNPDFTAQYNDFLGSGQYARSYQIQVIENGGDFNSPLWDSGQVDLDSYPPGLAEESVSEDIPYGGSALDLDGTQYNWRIRFYSAIGSISAWSDGTSSFTMQDIPTDPSGCSASRVSDVEFNVSWSDNSTYEDGFVVQRNTNSSGSYAGWQTLGTVSSDTTSFVDNSTNNPADPPQIDEKYQYRVYAYNTAGNSGYSTDAIEHYTTPDAPTEVAGNYVSDSQFSIGYTDNAGAEDTHHFNRCTGTNCDSATYETDLSTTESSPMTDSSGLSIDEKYRWRARSETPTLLYSSYGYSNYEYTTPSAPSAVVATYVSDNEIGLTWIDNSTYEDGFRIEVSTDAGAYEEISPGVNTVGAGITTYNFTGADTNHK